MSGRRFSPAVLAFVRAIRAHDWSPVSAGAQAGLDPIIAALDMMATAAMKENSLPQDEYSFQGLRSPPNSSISNIDLM